MTRRVLPPVARDQELVELGRLGMKLHEAQTRYVHVQLLAGVSWTSIGRLLEEIGAPFGLELVLARGEREGPGTATGAWRAVNPKGRVPGPACFAGSILLPPAWAAGPPCIIRHERMARTIAASAITRLSVISSTTSAGSTPSSCTRRW